MIPTLHRTYKRGLAAGFLLVASITMSGQTDTEAGKHKKIVHTHWIAWGHANLLDTYLSHETFKGSELRYTSQTNRADSCQTMEREAVQQLFISSAGTRATPNSLLTAMYNLKLGRYYRIRSPWPQVDLMLGGQLDATLGTSYHTRNSNNPAQARLSLSLNPAAKVKWQFCAFQQSFFLHYSAALPLVGLAFSPNYGQSYYEIFSEGHYDHNIVFTSPHTAPQLHHVLSLHFTLWKQKLCVGYMGDWRQMKANQIKYHSYTNGILIGWQY